MKIKENITLIIGLAIPVLMIIFVAASIYLPGLFTKPEYNFVYSTGGDYSYGTQYSVIDGKIEKNVIEWPSSYSEGYVEKQKDPKLFLYDLEKEEAVEISFEEAQKLELNSNPESPDEFTVGCGTRNSGFFFFDYGGRDCSRRYLRGHNTSKELNIQLSGSYYSDTSLRFIGWVEK